MKYIAIGRLSEVIPIRHLPMLNVILTFRTDVHGTQSPVFVKTGNRFPTKTFGNDKTFLISKLFWYIYTIIFILGLLTVAYAQDGDEIAVEEDSYYGYVNVDDLRESFPELERFSDTEIYYEYLEKYDSAIEELLLMKSNAGAAEKKIFDERIEFLKKLSAEVDSNRNRTFNSYDINVTIDAERHLVTGSETVCFYNTKGASLNKILVVLPPNAYESPNTAAMQDLAKLQNLDDVFFNGFDSGYCAIRSVRSGGSPVDYKIEKTRMELTLPAEIKRGDSFVFCVEFEIKIPNCKGDFGWIGDIMTMSDWNPIIAEYGEGGWVTSEYGDLSEKMYWNVSNYRAVFRIKKGLQFITSGLTREERADSEGYIKISVDAGLAIQLPMVVGKGMQSFSTNIEGIPVESYYYEENSEMGKTIPFLAEKTIRYYNFNFGKYPFKKLVFVNYPKLLPAAAYSRCGLVLIEENVYKLAQLGQYLMVYVISHETGHQWWGHVVLNDIVYGAWLSEGLAEYSLKRSFSGEMKKAERMGIEIFMPEYDFNEYALQGVGENLLQPLGQYESMATMATFIYLKSYEILKLIEKIVGREKMNMILRIYAERYKFRHPSTEDFISLCEEMTNTKIKEVIYMILTTPKFVDYSIDAMNLVTEDSGRYFELVVKNAGEVAVPFSIKIDDGKSKEEVYQDGFVGEKKIRIDNIDAITVTAMPFMESLDVERENNTYVRWFGLDLGIPFNYSINVPGRGYFFGMKPALLLDALVTKSQYDIGQSVVNYDNVIFGAEGELSRRFVSKMLADYSFTRGKWGLSPHFRIDNINYTRSSVNLDGRWEDGMLESAIYGEFKFSGIEKSSDSVKIGFGFERVYDINKMEWLYWEEGNIGTVFLEYSRDTKPKNEYNFFGVGEKLKFIVEGTRKEVTGSHDYLKAILDFNKSYRVAHMTTLAFRVMGGYSIGELPLQKKYYLGGMNLLRGYFDREFIGDKVLCGSVEFRFPIIKEIPMQYYSVIMKFTRLEGAVFSDFGSTYLAEEDIYLNYFKFGAGAGLRLIVDFGGMLTEALRLDVAVPVRRDITPWNVNYYLTIGYPF